jgi:hypothetical protein
MEWFNAGQSVKAFYFASTELKIQRDKKEAAKIKKGKRG